MSISTTLNTLKSMVNNAICHGDFLIPDHHLSGTWLNTDSWNSEQAQQTIQEVLCAFWRAFLRQHQKKHILLHIEYLEQPSDNDLLMKTLACNTADLLNSPNLSADTVLVDPDSFELYMEHWPTEREVMIFVERSIHHDLLAAVCSNLQALGCHVRGILTIVERIHHEQDDIRKSLQLDLIPCIVYNEQQEQAYSLLELHEEPYSAYHPYFV